VLLVATGRPVANQSSPTAKAASVAGATAGATRRNPTASAVGGGQKWGRFLPEHITAVSLLDRLLHHSIVVLTEGESFRMKEARQRGPRGGGRQPQKP
jgi:hypothetical protein